MKQLLLFLTVGSLFWIAACKPDKQNDITTDIPVTEQQVLDDFANVIVNPNYQDLQQKANELRLAVVTLNASCINSNLYAAQSAWRAIRVPWEQSEGFLFGPVEDYNYDPATDSWPVNTIELDSLIASNNTLTLADIDSLQDALRGYHPIEYLLFGVGGSRDASELSVRKLQYLVSLTENLYNVVTQLRNDWDPNQPNNFTAQLVTAGQGSVRFATRKDAFLTIVGAMEHICNEVANAKMEDPLVALDSSIVESQYAHNATSDFTNNIVGLQNVYMGTYGSGSGHCLHDLVVAKSTSLDNDIKSQISICIAGLLNIDTNYGLAIYTQQGQIFAAQQQINILHDKLDLLKQFVETNITD
ncbi:MAG: imelysin family protein [Bacteroidota bacterium]